jgi:hypothetical protein
MVSKDALIDYLLHRMPESERDDFAERWFAEPGLSHELEMAEAELLDAYVRSELAANERERVERYLLSSDVQRRKLAFAASLQQVLPKRKRRQISWFALCAAAMLAILAGAGLWMAFENRRLRVEVAELRQDAKPSPGGVYTVSLRPTLRGSGAAAPLVLAKDAGMLRVDLEWAEGERGAAYSATLSRAGKLVWKEEPLAEQSSEVTMWIPAQLLDAGSYTIALSARGNPVAYYTLTIAR